jgi:uncharacterized protein
MPGIGDISPAALLWGAAVLLVAGFVRGYSGFGFSAVVVAGLSIAFAPAHAVVLTILLEVAASLIQARSIWKDIDWRGSTVLLAGGLVGMPIGVMVLSIAPETPMKIAVYAYVLIVAMVLFLVPPVRRELSTAVWALIGFIAGIINGAVGLSGLFIVSIMTLTATPPARMRATLIAYFFFSDIYAAGLFAWRGMVTQDLLMQALFALPIVGIGIYFGSRHFLGASEAQFRRATLVFLSVLSLVGLATIAFTA